VSCCFCFCSAFGLFLKRAFLTQVLFCTRSRTGGYYSYKKDSTVKREAFFIEFADRIRSSLPFFLSPLLARFRF